MFLFISISLGLGQKDIPNNSIEFGLIAGGADEDQFFHTKIYHGNGLRFAYKRKLLKSRFYNFSIGCSARYFDAYLRRSYQNPEKEYHNLLFISSHQFYSFGVILNNQFNVRIKRFGYFLNLDLDIVHPFIFKQDTKLHDQGWEVFTLGPEIEIENEIATRKIIFEPNIQIGTEYYIGKKVTIYLAFALNRTLNSIFQNSTISPLIPGVDDIKYIGSAITIGVRF